LNYVCVFAGSIGPQPSEDTSIVASFQAFGGFNRIRQRLLQKSFDASFTSDAGNWVP
jgi:hypothetical protein